MPAETVFTEAQWHARAEELFGPNLRRWVFKCPACANEMSIARAEAEFPGLRGRGWRPEAECIGRYIDTPAALMILDGKKSDRRCDWAAYGLLCGPWTVVIEREGKTRPVHVFEFGAPSVQTRQSTPTAAPGEPA